MHLLAKELEKIANRLRIKTIHTSHLAKIPHLGSCLSCLDILVVLYFHILRIDPKDPSNIERDRFILSKGHAAPALFQVLAEKGFYSKKLLETYGEDGGVFSEHPPAPGHLPGIEAATGSLGHGLSLATGMALAGKIQGMDYRVFALLSDGECNEGAVWESAMFAAAQGLNNLTVIIDFNKWQATGRSCKVMSLEPLDAKWRSFGWDVSEIDGHNILEVVESLKSSQKSALKPKAIIAHTIKGKGVSFMEDDNNWHYCIPSVEQFNLAQEQLSQKV